jgi:hypothetical protein
LAGPEHKARQAQRVTKASRERLVRKDRKALQATTELLAHPVQLDLKDQQDRKATRAIRATGVRPEPMAQRERPEQQAQRVRKDRRATLETPARLDLKAFKAPQARTVKFPARQARQERKAKPARLVRLARLVRKGRPDLRGRRAIPGTLALQEPRARLALRDRPGQRARKEYRASKVRLVQTA